MSNEVAVSDVELVITTRRRRATRPWYGVLWALPVQSFWRCFATILTLVSANAFWRLGDTFVRDYDEGRYGVAASEMLHRHSLLVTTYAGSTEFWNLKPPLGYWLLEISYSLFGETPFALRAPAALCAVLTTALTMIMARRMAGPRAAILSGLIVATSFGFLAHHGARSGELDMPLTLLMFLMFMLAPGLYESRAARLGTGLVLALGFLLKSFAVLPFVAAIGAHTLLTRGLRCWRAWVLPSLIVVVVTISWAIARTVAEDSSEFVRRMFVEDLFLRSTTAIDPVEASIWDYVGALFDRFAPWPLVVVVACGISWTVARARWRGEGSRVFGRQLTSDSAILLGCYCLIPLLLFTLARTHHSHYIVPLYPAWAILGAVAALELVNAAGRVQWSRPALGILLTLVLACEARIIAQVEIRDRLSHEQVLLASLRERLGPGAQLYVAFTPTYSERFFLQVVDGFVLKDAPSDRDPPSNALVLMRNSGLQSYALARIR